MGQSQKTRKKATDALLQDAENLFNITKQYAKQYYGKDLSCIEKMNRILSWIEKNTKTISNKLIKEIQGGNFDFLNQEALDEKKRAHVLGVWIGTQYLGANEIKNEFTFSIEPLVTMESSEYILETIPASPDCFVVGINQGIHETTHLIPALLLNQSFTALPEISAVYAQMKYGPPMRMKGAGFPFGGRNFYTVANVLGFLNEEEPFSSKLSIMNEYIGGAILPWILAYYEKNGKEFDLKKFGNKSKGMNGNKSKRRTIEYKLFEFLKTDMDQINEAIDLIGIPESESIIKEKLNIVLVKLRYSCSNDEKEFVSNFIRLMTQQFEDPKKEDLPLGYADFLPKKCEKNVLADKTREKKPQFFT